MLSDRTARTAMTAIITKMTAVVVAVTMAAANAIAEITTTSSRASSSSSSSSSYLSSLHDFLRPDQSTHGSKYVLIARAIALILFITLLYINVLQDSVKPKIKSKISHTNGSHSSNNNNSSSSSTVVNTTISHQAQSNIDSITIDDTLSASSKIVVFSGGSAFQYASKLLNNSINSSIIYILPVSDDGGSSGEIIRKLGGPSIGDIRGTLCSIAGNGLSILLSYRIHAFDILAAKQEIVDIIDGNHDIWSYMEQLHSDIETSHKNICKSYLLYFFNQVTKPSSSTDDHSNDDDFDFRCGSIGNFVITGARLFYGSLDSAIVSIKNLLRIPVRIDIYPCIVTSNNRVSLEAVLSDGTTIRGQHNISHPCDFNAKPQAAKAVSSKQKLSSRIKYVRYVNDAGKEVVPVATASIIRSLQSCNTIIYSMGSLFTSLIPSLIVPTVGDTIRSLACPKVLLLNGCNDRETTDMTLEDYVCAIILAMKQTSNDVLDVKKKLSMGNSKVYLNLIGAKEIKKYITCVMFVDNSDIINDNQLEWLQSLGVVIKPILSAAMIQSVDEFVGTRSTSTLDTFAMKSVVDDSDGDGSTATTTNDVYDENSVNTSLIDRFVKKSNDFIVTTPGGDHKQGRSPTRGLIEMAFGSRVIRGSTDIDSILHATTKMLNVRSSSDSIECEEVKRKVLICMETSYDDKTLVDALLYMYKSHLVRDKRQSRKSFNLFSAFNR